MTEYRVPKEPLFVIPKATRLREKARALRSKAEALLREADALVVEAQDLEADLAKRKPREVLNHVAAQIAREATDR